MPALPDAWTTRRLNEPWLGMQDNSAKTRPVFHTLDAFRGVAALCVMIYHYAPYIVPGRLLPGGYLAVDMFFGLSGFVIAYAYDARLPRIRAWGFMRSRLIRLYPLYLLGSLLGVGFVLARNFAEPTKYVPFGALLPALSENLLMLPALPPRAHLIGPYPFDQTSWTLSCEMAVNLLYGLVFRFLTPRRLMLIVAVSFLGLLYCGMHYGTIDVGMTPETLWCGSVRTCFSFFLGVLIFRLHGTPAALPWQTGAVLLVLLLGVFIAGPMAREHVAVPLLCAAVVFPLFIHWGSRCPRLPRLGPVLDRTATLSYAIYILHVPLAEIIDRATHLAFHVDPTRFRPYSGLVYLAITIVLAQAAVSFYDVPVRAWLGRLGHRVARPPIEMPTPVPPAVG